MAFQPINFLSAPIQRDDRIQNFADSLMKGLSTGFTMRQQAEQNKRAQEAFDFDKSMKESQLAREQELYQQSQDPLYKYKQVSESLKDSNIPKELIPYIQNQALGFKSGQTPEQEQEFELKKSRTAKELTPEQINLLKAQANYYNNRPATNERPVAGVKYEQNFLSNLAKDNPDFNEEQLRQAGNRVIEGDRTLDDGMPIKVGGITTKALDQYIKTTTTSGLIDADIRGQKAESELPVITKYIQRGNNIYPTDVLKLSLAKAADTAKAAKGDKQAIDRLAQNAAGNVLSYEQSQLQQLLASGKTTVQATKEIQKHAERRLVDFGIGSGAVKNKALDYINEATKEAFKARRGVSSGASATLYKKEKQEEKETNKGTEQDPLGLR